MDFKGIWKRQENKFHWQVLDPSQSPGKEFKETAVQQYFHRATCTLKGLLYDLFSEITALSCMAILKYSRCINPNDLMLFRNLPGLSIKP